ncbi:hypothetical protein AB0H36_02410 [Kribbella sp. NPDC050820]|uniref:hypothetical protein n=1 Tax=Kribbella sp. NPDC050820 TaxID=3155408 RepID=UPI0034026312
MSFQDLPQTWTDHPLSDPTRAADVVDLLVSLGDRHRGTFTVILCDENTRYRAAIAVDLPSEFGQPPAPPSPLAARATSTPPLARTTSTSPLAARTMPTSSLAAGAMCTSALTPIIPAVRTAPGTSLLLALGRPGPDTWPDLDTEWAHAATHLCRTTAVPLLGFYIATPHHIYQPQLPIPTAA